MNVKFEQKLTQVVIYGIDGPSEETVHCNNVFYKEKIWHFYSSVQNLWWLENVLIIN